jgi:LCP family protein required for cell wall assembly
MMHKKSPGAARKYSNRNSGAGAKGRGTGAVSSTKSKSPIGVQTKTSKFSRQNAKHQAAGAKAPQSAKAKGGKNARKPWSLGKKVLVGAAAAVLVVLAVGAALALTFLHDIDSKISIGDIQMKKLDVELVPPQNTEEPYYVLLVGSDSRDPGDMGTGNSDTIMLVRVDPEKPAVSLISIPRDVEVNIPDHGNQKINAAYAYNGPAGAVNVVSSLCGVDIAHYVEIDFQGVINLVDVLGGIDVVLPVDISLDDVYIPAGPQHLDGAHALVVSRCRTFDDGDFTRVKNQRIILQAVAKAVLSAGATEMPGLISKLAECVKADVNSTEAIALLLKLQGMDTASGMEMATIPAGYNPHDGISFLAVKEPEFSEMMSRFRNGEPLELPQQQPEQAQPEQAQPESGEQGDGQDGQAETSGQTDSQTEEQGQGGA